ncbi:hypothetical protein PG357_02795 [Riemerella anatipestifer]|uniref:hypothetical protein n=1 Tax=Riemerella anatipestifer TaxID=34085 RepID=UPI00069A7912|nr:hypothetical protein [Riemerella anatipestifer]MDY3350908.1 hypothetical protein [Riemerella anatipestifer]MDY3537071.1 hypothetical protein [Riemerella anatipestifer]
MKNIIAIFCLLVSVKSLSQVIIGGEIGTYTTDTESILLQFSSNENRGIVVPYVRELPSSPVEGTIVLDVQNPEKARMKYFNGSWIDLSQQDGNVTSSLLYQPVGVGDESDSKVIIGDPNTSADGVLVLESQSKAMVLPIVNDFKNIINPAPGMMVFINKSGAKRLAVFNGTKWSFWKD